MSRLAALTSHYYGELTMICCIVTILLFHFLVHMPQPGCDWGGWLRFAKIAINIIMYNSAQSNARVVS